MSNEPDQLRQRITQLEAENIQLKTELQNSQDAFRKIFHASPNIMAIHTIEEGRFVDLNEACAAFGGFTRDELLGKTLEERGLLVESGMDRVISGKLQEEGKVKNAEIKIRKKDGEMLTVLFSADPILFNNVPCLLGVSVDITEREKEADALRQSEEKYRMLVENSLQGLTILQDSRLVFCNNTFASMLGYSVEELLLLSSDQVKALAHPDDRSNIENRYHDQLSGKPVASRFEYRGIKRDGAVIWVEAYASAITYNGKPAIQSVYMDITDRKVAEDALRESEERFRLIAETIDEIFWIYDGEKKVATYLSPAYDRIWDYPRERIIGNPEPFMDPVHPDDRENTFIAGRAMIEGRPMSVEYRIIRPDGTIRHIWNRGYPVFEKDGKVKRFVGVGQDVTEWRRAEEALKETKEYLNQIINCIGDLIFVKDSNHRITLVNDALCAFSGMKREDLIGSADMPEAVARSLWDQEESVLETGKETLSEDTLTDAQGNSRVLMTKKSLLIDKSGNKQIVGVIRDITEYKHLEAQFLQSQKMEAIGVLAGGVAHDFNNILNVINGYCELLLDGLETDEHLRKDLEQIRDAGQRAAILTSQLLDFGRKQILQPEIIDLNDVIAEMSSMLRRMIGEDIELEFNAQTDRALINADPGKIQQVVMNLVVNARDAMPNGGRILIETASVKIKEEYLKSSPGVKAGAHIMLTITDNGVGMDAETQAHMFEPFFTTKAIGKGTGLGLSTVYGIVKQSDGFVLTQSEVDRGTTVKIYIPCANARIYAVPPEKKVESESSGLETILLVEDEVAVRALTHRILSDRGYHVLEAVDGLDALRVSREFSEDIHLVVTDVVMPGMGGKALVSRLEESRPGIRTLFISGYTDDAISHHGILDSDVDFLQKPFAIDALIHKVRKVLDS